MEVFAIYFPSYHPNPHYSSWYGFGWTEWELVKTTRPVYPGHRQPKVPMWGYFDESNPDWSAKEIELAADFGITGFLFDWYWYSGVRIMEEALENGFLRAPNRDRLKFAIMWANHNWGTWPAVTGKPGMGAVVGSEEGQPIWLYIRHCPKDLDHLVDYCCEHYFSEPNYWRIDDKPNFVIYDIAKFIEQLGGVDGAKACLERMDGRTRKNGLNGIYFTANIGCCDDNIYCCGWNRVRVAKQLGFQSVFAYNIVRTKNYLELTDEFPVVQYEDVMESHRYCWERIEKGGLSHYPVVTMGCDVSPRWHRGVGFPMDFRKLNYEPIVEGNTPEKFGELCRLALRWAKSNGSAVQAIFINAWNEWTEGMYLLPEEQYGTRYLEELKKAIQLEG